MPVDRISTVQTPAATYDLVTLAQVKAELNLPAGLPYATSADTASGQVLPFLGTNGIQALSPTDGSPMTVAGLNIQAGCVVSGVTPTSVTLSLPIAGDVPAGTIITFGNDNLLDTYLAGKITQVSDAIQTYCKRTFPVDTIQDLFLFPRGKNDWMIRANNEILQLAKWPLVDVESVSVLQDGVATALVLGTDYLIDQTAGQLVRLNSFSTDQSTWAWRPLATTVLYEAGFAAVPGDVVDACLRLVTKAYWGRGKDPSIIQTGSEMAGMTRYWFDDAKDGNLPPDIQDLLKPYRVPGFG